MRHVCGRVGRTSVLPFVSDVVATGASVLTDGSRSYIGLDKLGFVHKQTILSTSSDPAHVSMPGVHRIASLLKRWVLGTHQGSVTPDHLQSYLEEFTFRFNRRSLAQPWTGISAPTRASRRTGPVTEDDVTGGYDW